MEEIERTLLVKPEVFIYKIGPRPSARGYRAADWNLTTPDWTGRLRCSSKGKKCTIHLEDKSSGQLFAACPVEHYPGSSVEAVTDSSRYFVICVQDSGRKAFLGMGFADRSDSFDLNVALQDHFKWVKKEDGFAKEAELPPAKKLDLAFKEGQTIRINIPKKDTDGGESAVKARPKTGGMGLPPPPGGIKIGPPPGASNLTPMQSPTEPSKNVIGGGAASNADLLGDLLGGGLPIATAPVTQPAASSSNSLLAGNLNMPSSTSSQPQKDPFGDDPWGDFASAPAVAPAESGNWTSFE